MRRHEKSKPEEGVSYMFVIFYVKRDGMLSSTEDICCAKWEIRESRGKLKLGQKDGLAIDRNIIRLNTTVNVQP